MDEGAEVRAFYDLFLVNQIECLSESIMCSESTTTKFVACNYFVPRKRKLELPSNGYIQNNRMNIQCDLTVVRDSELCKTKGSFKIQVPSDLSEHFSRLLLNEEEANVIFSVRGEIFLVHKIVLATWSPVFKAQLYGKMKETKARCVTMEDMPPDVFKSLLNFIYTDVLPVFDDDIDDDDYSKMINHLLVAVDRYAMDRLKHLRVEIVATTQALAD
jgi:speckle-type POZ protein